MDFYVLKSAAPKQRWTFACRLAEKAYLRNLRVVMLGESAAETEALDELLWTFKEGSFVPHERLAGGAAVAGMTPPVRLTPDLESIDSADLLVNLAAQLPGRLERFGRIAEIIDADDERRARGRERFKSYRELKLTVETHHDE